VMKGRWQQTSGAKPRKDMIIQTQPRQSVISIPGEDCIG
jgi:hypothetical protein